MLRLNHGKTHPGANAHRFLPVPLAGPVPPSSESAGSPVVWPSRPVFDQVATGHRNVLDQRHRTSLIKMPGRVLLVKGVLRRHSIDRHDHLEATLGCALARARDRALRRGAGDDDRADALVLERLFEIGVVPLVGTASVLDQVLARSWREARIDHVLDLWS